MSIPLLTIVDYYGKQVTDGRTVSNIRMHLHSEVVELDAEVDLLTTSQPAGEDGVFGECIDVLACVLDIMLQIRPDASLNELELEMEEYLTKKCIKWRNKFLVRTST